MFDDKPVAIMFLVVEPVCIYYWETSLLKLWGTRDSLAAILRAKGYFLHVEHLPLDDFIQSVVERNLERKRCYSVKSFEYHAKLLIAKKKLGVL